VWGEYEFVGKDESMCAGSLREFETSGEKKKIRPPASYTSRNFSRSRE